MGPSNRWEVPNLIWLVLAVSSQWQKGALEVVVLRFWLRTSAAINDCSAVKMVRALLSVSWSIF
jgi:hypothetical protein